MILLDTHVLVWADTDDRKLGRKTRALIDRNWNVGQVAVSAIVFWESALLQAGRRVSLPGPVSEWRPHLLAAGLLELPVDGAIAVRAVDLVGIADDLADRFIAATAIDHGATLVTADDALLSWKHALQRHDARV